jgi:hypothetical protein
MENGVGDRGGHARNADFTDPSRTHGSMLIGNIVEQNLDVRHIQIDRQISIRG